MAINIDRLKKRIYEIVEASHGTDRASRSYDIMILIAVIVGLLPLTMRSENTYTRIIDLVIVALFALDYIARLFTSDYKMGVKSYKAYVYYAFTPMAIIDLLSLVPILAFFIPGKTVIGMFRIFRVLQVLKLVRYSKTMRRITNVIRKIKSELMAVLILVVIYILTAALVIFQVEPNMFDSFFEAVYWATVSVTTIGYGDIAPATPIGQFITMLSALVGVAVIALPSGIITAGYMDEMKRTKSKLEL